MLSVVYVIISFKFIMKKKKSNHEKILQYQVNAISTIILLVVFITSYSVTGQTFTGSNLPIVIITTDNDPNTNLP
jgi:uncharacterized membrane protein YozB (DUF420 family)